MIKDLLATMEPSNWVLAGYLLNNLSPVEIFNEFTSAVKESGKFKLTLTTKQFYLIDIFENNITIFHNKKELLFFRSNSNTSEFKQLIILKCEEYANSI